MNPFRITRREIASAYAWKHNEEARLIDEIRREEIILRTTRTQLARIRQIEGRNLALYYDSLDPEDIEKSMRSKREFLEEIEGLIIEGIWKGTAGKLFEKRSRQYVRVHGVLASRTWICYSV
jgi:hypothetical protein